MLRDYIELPLPVRILCFGSFLNRAGSFAVIFLSIYASEQLGFGVQFATACLGVMGLGCVAGSVLGGHLADHWGRRAVMLLALLGGGLCLMLMSVQTTRFGFMATVFFFSLLVDMYRPAASAMIGDLVSEEHRPHAFALMYISINLGFAVAPPIGGILAEYSFQWLFWADAATMVLYGGIIIVWIRETLGRDGEAADQQASPGVLESTRRILGDRVFIMFCLSTLLMGIVFMQGFSTLPIYIRQIGFSNLEFGILMSVNGLMIFLLQLPMTHWLNRFNGMSNIIAGTLLISVGFGLTAIHGGFLFLSLTIAVWTLGEILQAPFTQAVVTDLAPSELRGRYLGLFSTSYAVALMIGAPIGGEVLTRFGPAILWLFMGCLASVAVMGYCLIHRGVTARRAQG